MINLHHELAVPQSSYMEALRLLRMDGRLLVVDGAADDEQGRPPQHVRALPELIGAMLSIVGFESLLSHSALPKHSLLTARKPAVCGP